MSFFPGSGYPHYFRHALEIDGEHLVHLLRRHGAGLDTLPGQTLRHFRVAQLLADFGIHALHDFARRGHGREQPQPAVELIAAQAAFGERRAGATFARGG